MVLSQPSPVSFNPIAPQPIPTAEQKPSPAISQQLPTTPPDQVDLSAAATTTAGRNPSLEKPNKPAVRFGKTPTNTNTNGTGQTQNNQPAKDKSWWRTPLNILKKTAAGILCLGSSMALAVAVPLALLQFAVGLIIHPLLITGALTLALPIMGIIASVFLGKSKK